MIVEGRLLNDRRIQGAVGSRTGFARCGKALEVFESAIELNGLRETARRLIDQCCHSIETFLYKIKKYEPSLRDAGSMSVIRDATTELRWQLGYSDELTKSGAEIQAHFSAINILLGTANL